MASDRTARSRWFWRWIFGIALLFALIYVVTHLEEGRDFARQLGSADASWLVVAVALQAGTYLADAAVWAVALARMRESHRMKPLLRFTMAKFFVDQFVPTGGVTGTVLVMRSLEKEGVSRHGSTAALVVRFVSYYAAYAIALAAGLAIAWLRADLPRWVLGIGTGLTAIFVAIPAAIFLFLRRPGVAIPAFLARRRLVRRLEPTLRAMGASAPEVLRDAKLLAGSTALQLAIFVLDAATLWVAFLSVGTPAAPGSVYAAFMLALAVGSLGLVPGAVGTFEAGAVAAFGLMGISVAAALAAVILFRGLSLWLPLLPGFYWARKESWR